MEMTPEELDEQFDVHDEEIWDNEPVEVGGWDEANALESAGYGEAAPAARLHRSCAGPSRRRSETLTGSSHGTDETLCCGRSDARSVPSNPIQEHPCSPRLPS